MVNTNSQLVCLFVVHHAIDNFTKMIKEKVVILCYFNRLISLLSRTYVQIYVLNFWFYVKQLFPPCRAYIIQAFTELFPNKTKFIGVYLPETTWSWKRTECVIITYCESIISSVLAPFFLRSSLRSWWSEVKMGPELDKNVIKIYMVTEGQ